LFFGFDFGRRGYGTNEMVRRIKRAQKIRRLTREWGRRTVVLVGLTVAVGLGTWSVSELSSSSKGSSTVGSSKGVSRSGAPNGSLGSTQGNKQVTRMNTAPHADQSGCGDSQGPVATKKRNRSLAPVDRELKKQQQERANQLRRSLNKSWWPFSSKKKSKPGQQP
jgi:hypothetical protein